MSNDRNKEIIFARALEDVKKLAKEQNYCVTKEQIMNTFSELALSEEQYEMICQYLKQHKIGVGEQVDPDDYLEQEEKDYLETYL